MVTSSRGAPRCHSFVEYTAGAQGRARSGMWVDWLLVLKRVPSTWRLGSPAYRQLANARAVSIHLEVTYEDGRPWVAYLYLPRQKNEKSDHCVEVEPDMVLDINKDGKLIGIELLAPQLVTSSVNSRSSSPRRRRLSTP